MSGSEPIHFTARAEPAPAELAMFDHAMRPVGRGVGSLEIDVPTGMYMIRAQIGASVEERLMRVSSTNAHASFRLEVPSATPTDGTSTLNETHADAASAMSQQPTIKKDGVDSRLLLMVRDIRGVKGRPIEPEDLEGVQLRDTEGGTVFPVDAAARDAKALAPQAVGWAGFSADLPSGGYVLRWRLDSNERKNMWGAAETLEQSIVLPHPGETRGIGLTEWTLCVFVHRDPRTGRILRETTRAHLTPKPIGFQAWASEAVEINLALEAALTALRLGEPAAVVDLESDQLRLLLGDKFANPMLGIVGAHALLLRSRVDWRLFEIVLGNLDKLMPGHPDVAALRAMGSERRDRRGYTDIDAVAVPPMLAASYEGLVARDWQERGLLQLRSLAERIGGRLVSVGPWTTWSGQTERVASARAETMLRGGGDEDSVADIAVVDRAVLDRARAWARAASKWASDEGEFFKLDAEQLGSALRLPPTVAAHVVEILGDE